MRRRKDIRIKVKRVKDEDTVEVTLTAKQKKFCDQYVKHFDYHRAFDEAGYTASNNYSKNSAVCELRQKPHVWEYLKSILQDAEKIVGISRSEVLQMHKDIAYSSIAHLHNTWVERKDFDKLTDKEKWTIAEIDTKVRREVIENDGEEQVTLVEYVRIKLLDKQKALDAISKMVGYDEPSKLELNGNKEMIKKLFPFGE